MKNMQNQNPLVESNSEKKIIEKKVQQAKIFKIISVVLLLLLLYMTYKYVMVKEDALESKLTNISKINGTEINSVDIQAKDYVMGYIKGLYETKYPFFAKLLMLLGTIYLIQITFSIFGDLIEILLIIGLGIYKLFKWIKSKLSSKEKSLNSSYPSVN